MEMIKKSNDKIELKHEDNTQNNTTCPLSNDIIHINKNPAGEFFFNYDKYVL